MRTGYSEGTPTYGIYLSHGVQRVASPPAHRPRRRRLRPARRSRGHPLRLHAPVALVAALAVGRLRCDRRPGGAARRPVGLLPGARAPSRPARLGPDAPAPRQHPALGAARVPGPGRAGRVDARRPVAGDLRLGGPREPDRRGRGRSPGAAGGVGRLRAGLGLPHRRLRLPRSLAPLTHLPPLVEEVAPPAGRGGRSATVTRLGDGACDRPRPSDGPQYSGAVRASSSRRNDSTRSGSASPRATASSSPHSGSPAPCVQPRGQSSVISSRSGNASIRSSGRTCASPNDLIPGVSMIQPAGPSSPGRANMIAEVEVCRPRPVTALTTPTSRPASGTSALTKVDFPTPL